MLKVDTCCPGQPQRQWVQRSPSSVQWSSALSEELGREAQNRDVDGRPRSQKRGWRSDASSGVRSLLGTVARSRSEVTC